MEDQTFTFTWEVCNFNLLFDMISSDRFKTSVLNDSSWIAYLVPQIHSDPSRSIVYLYLMRRAHNDPTVVGLNANLSILRSDGGPWNDVTFTMNITETGRFVFLKFGPDLERICPGNETLKVKCVLKKASDVFTTKNLAASTTRCVKKVCKVWDLKSFSQTGRDVVLEDSVMEEGGELLFDICVFVEEGPTGGVMKIEFIRRDPQCRLMVLNALVSVLDLQGKESEIWKQDLHVFREGTPKEVWQFPTFTLKDIFANPNEYLTNDVLRLKCEIAMSFGSCKSEIGNDTDFFHKSIRDADHITDDMKDLFNTKRFADITLRASGGRVAAHRIILRSLSKKFAGILEENGTDSDVLDVPGMTVITLIRMLRYMYMGEMEDLEYDDLVEVYAAAHMYNIESLKCRCSFVLGSLLRVSNVCKVLMLSDSVSDYDLENCAFGFIKRNWDLVSPMEEWESLLKERKELAREISAYMNRPYINSYKWERVGH